MPGFDGTGPRGQGPMTGGGFGYCATPGVPGTRRRGGGFRGVGRVGAPWGGGRGMAWGGGRGMGRGRGYRVWAGRGYWGPRYPVEPYGFDGLSPEEELASLKTQAGYLEEELNVIRSRIDALSKGVEGEE